MRSFMSFLAGALCGALVGSVTALLMAPTSGEVLQDQMRERANTVINEVRDAYETRMAQLEAELEALRKPPKPVEE
jgi:gas vesicle protein